MKCSKCGKEIANDSVFCEYCGALIKKRKKKMILVPLFCILFVCFIVGVLSVLNYYRWKTIEEASIGTWPLCSNGNGTFHILQKQNGLLSELVLIEGEFPIEVKHVASTQGEIYTCQGEHSGLGAFAFLSSHNNQITFVTNYNSGGCLIRDFLITSTTEDGKDMYSDKNHIYGLNTDLVCGRKEENVRSLFPDALGQPVKVNTTWRYVLIGGEYMFEDDFDDAYPFCYGLARVCKNGQWFYIDRDKHELRLNFGGGKNYQIIQGGDFYYDKKIGKVVAEMQLCEGGNVFWKKVDITGCQLYEVE